MLFFPQQLTLTILKGSIRNHFKQCGVTIVNILIQLVRMQVKECHAIQCHGPKQTPLYESVKLQDLTDNDLLIKTQASGIGHLDLWCIQGFITKMGGSYPFIPGTDGVGRVVNAGKNVQHLLKKRVLVMMGPQGFWSEYVVVNVHAVVPIDEEVSVESAAFGIGNPFTVMGLLDVISKEGKKSVVFDAAASALGRMFNRMAKKHGIHVVNVVKRQDQKQVLVKEGAEHVVVTEGDWKGEYEQLVKGVNASCMIDSLGSGEVFNTLVKGLPPGGLVILIGGLDGIPEIDFSKPGKVEVDKYTFQGFALINWIMALTPQEKEKLYSGHSQLLKKELATTVQHKFHFKDIGQALEVSKKGATNGKTMLIP